ncbi:MAG TPA: DNA methyltransferase [Lactobacillaceae bacterium]|jgi:adenine-specific DNA-methyltransferase
MIRDNLLHNEHVEPNSATLAKLQQALPEYFSSASTFDLEKLAADLRAHNTQELNSGYQLDFIGKDYAKKQVGERPTTVIVPDNTHNAAEVNVQSENLFFTGDNLEVLRHLQANYQNSIDFIYIDPPYNTGSDGFVYPDKFEYSDDTLKNQFGLDDDGLKRLKSIQGKSTHSAWLTFMYPRLALAKKLLKDSGVIFVSIDDNEQANLKLLMDDLFGETTEQLVWNKEAEGKSGTLKQVSRFRNVHEYVTIGYKNINSVEFSKIHEALIGRENELQTANLAVNSERENPNHENYFSITNPNGDVFTRQWKWNQAKIKELIAEDLIFWGSDGHKQPRLIIPTDERRTTYLESILNYGGTTSGRKDFEKLLPEGVFSYPKPVVLIKKILEAATKKDATILDFFAGSSTTADAVMQLNAEDGGNRRFIMATLPEPTFTVNAAGQQVPTKGGEVAFNAGFKSIDEISRERIKRAAAKVQAENPNWQGDAGFKHFRMVAPTQKTLDDIDNFDELATTLDLFDDMLTPFSSDELQVSGDATGYDTVLQTYLVADGYRFDVAVENLTVAGYQLPYVDGTRVYIINSGWHIAQTKALVNAVGTNELVLQTIVVYGYSLSLEDLRELEIALAQLDSKVNLIVRY